MEAATFAGLPQIDIQKAKEAAEAAFRRVAEDPTNTIIIPIPLKPPTYFYKLTMPQGGDGNPRDIAFDAAKVASGEVITASLAAQAVAAQAAAKAISDKAIADAKALADAEAAAASKAAADAAATAAAIAAAAAKAAAEVAKKAVDDAAADAARRAADVAAAAAFKAAEAAKKAADDAATAAASKAAADAAKLVVGKVVATLDKSALLFGIPKNYVYLGAAVIAGLVILKFFRR